MEVLDELVHARHGGGREVSLDVESAECLAEASVDAMGCALPGRLRLFLAEQSAMEELEVLSLERRVEVGGTVVEDVPAQVAFPRAQRGGIDQNVDVVEELGLPHDHVRGSPGPSNPEVLLPAEPAVAGPELFHLDAIVVALGVAQVDAAATNSGQRGLKGKNVLGRMSSTSRKFARQVQDLLEVALIRRPDLGEAVEQIVIPVRQGQAALSEIEGIHSTLLLIGCDPRGKCRRYPGPMEARDGRRDLDRGLDLRDTAELRLDRTSPQARP